MNDIKSVLFVCNMNAVRSPMASRQLHARLGNQINCESAGIESATQHENGIDELTQQVLAETGIEMDDYYSKTLADIAFDRFDLIIAMTGQAAGELRKLIPSAKIEFWPIEDPSIRIREGECPVGAYRAVRDSILEKIEDRFPLTG